MDGMAVRIRRIHQPDTGRVWNSQKKRRIRIPDDGVRHRRVEGGFAGPIRREDITEVRGHRTNVSAELQRVSAAVPAQVVQQLKRSSSADGGGVGTGGLKPVDGDWRSGSPVDRT